MEHDEILNIHYSAPDEVWEKWYLKLKEDLTVALGYEIGEPENRYDFKYWDS